MLEEASADELLDLVRPDITAAASKDRGEAIDEYGWSVVALRRNERGDQVLVAWEGASECHALVLFPSALDDREIAVTICHGGPYLSENCFLGRWKWRRRWATCGSKGVFATAFIAEPGACAVQYERKGQTHTAPISEADCGRCIIVDWDDPRPIDRFTAIELTDGVVEPAIDCLPYSARFVADRWNAYWEDFSRSGPVENNWFGSIFYELNGEDFRNLTFAILRALDSTRHDRGIAQLGAGPIYGNGHWFYDRIERETDIPPQNIYGALTLERPEFLPPDVAERYTKLMRDLKARLDKDRRR